MLIAVDEAARRSAVAGSGPTSIYTYGLDPLGSGEDRALEAALRRHGYTDASWGGGVMMRGLEHLAQPEVPDGYHCGWVRTREQMVSRVEAHQAAFAPSDLTVERYERVQRTWPYRRMLDRVVLTGDGDVAAF